MKLAKKPIAICIFTPFLSNLWSFWGPVFALFWLDMWCIVHLDISPPEDGHHTTYRWTFHHFTMDITPHIKEKITAKSLYYKDLHPFFEGGELKNYDNYKNSSKIYI
jgi:hypothetical protein